MNKQKESFYPKNENTLDSSGNKPSQKTLFPLVMKWTGYFLGVAIAFSVFSGRNVEVTRLLPLVYTFTWSSKEKRSSNDDYYDNNPSNN
jgi:hypothetical protein